MHTLTRLAEAPAASLIGILTENGAMYLPLMFPIVQNVSVSLLFDCVPVPLIKGALIVTQLFITMCFLSCAGCSDGAGEPLSF